MGGRKKVKILVTGSDGFIGKNLIEGLKNVAAGGGSLI